ncbi:HEAT repeat domain-containing protein [Fervidobacterium thailandense]|nr:HEAT repeat domain-containing protein [Fervidobacterium thailandense]
MLDERENGMDRDQREALIQRILTEKGKDAFKDLVRLLDDEDENVRELAAEVIYRLGEEVKPDLEKAIKERIRAGEKNDTVLLYLIDIAGDLELRSVAKDLISALSLYDFEESQLVIYEALAKLGYGEEFYPLLRYMLLEGEERFYFGSQVAMVMSYLDIPEVVSDFVEAIDSGDFRDEDLEIIKKALGNIIARRPSYKEILITLVGEENFENYVL